MRIIQLIFVRLLTYVVTEYTHDMQGRLTKINDPDNPAGAPFCMELQYQDPDIAGATARYTAGASATRWIHHSGSTQTYVYNYDQHSRLISGVHSGSNNEQAISYDSNGNITTDGIRGMNIDYNYLDYDAQGTKLATAINDTIINYYTGMVVYRDDKSMDYIINSTGMIRKQGQQYVRQYNITDHLGSTRAVVDESANVIQATDYYPYGLPFQYNSLEKNRYLYNNKEIQNQSLGSVFLGTYDYGARFYDPELGRWHSVDPMAHLRTWVSPYNFVSNNPINRVDPTGALDDWVESANGDIYWDENATSQETTKERETYLGKNVLVGTHNRDANLNEPINSARFDLYLESYKTGPSATIYGNTVPADIEKYGTVAEGLYPAEYSIYKGDGAILINGGGNLPTVSGNPNNHNNYNADGSLKPISEHVIDEVFFHKGNYARKSLSTS